MTDSALYDLIIMGQYRAREEIGIVLHPLKLYAAIVSRDCLHVETAVEDECIDVAFSYNARSALAFLLHDHRCL
jgi:hypothetical protein